jgi:hypothetical protein
MSEQFVTVVIALTPHLIVLEVAVLLALRVIWRLPDWGVKVVVFVAVTRRLRRSDQPDSTNG